MNINNLIHILHYEDFDNYLRFFGNYYNFFRIVDKKGLIDTIDIKSDYSSDWESEYLLYLLENHKEKFNKIILNELRDVKIIDGTPYIILNNLNSLLDLFCDNGRNLTPVNIISQVLSDDLLRTDEYNYDGTYDIITNLDSDNLKILSRLILDNLFDTVIHPETTLLNDMLDENNVVQLNEDNIFEVIEDKDTIEFILENYLPEIEYGLISLYTDTYNLVLSDTLHNNILEELNRYFVMDTLEWVSFPNRFKKNTNTLKVKIKIWNFYSDLHEFLNNDSITNFGSYLLILEDLTKTTQECLEVYWPHHLDSEIISEKINELFTEYF